MKHKFKAALRALARELVATKNPTSDPQTPCGLWPSPITPKFLAQGLRLGDSAWDSDGRTLVWLEGRSDKGVLVCSRLDGDCARDLTGELSVRARIGYGGGDFCVGRWQVVFASGGRLYAQALGGGNSGGDARATSGGGGEARAITPGFGQAAAPALSPDGHWVLYVFSHEGKDGLAVVDIEGKFWPRKVAEGRDFFMQPRWSPDGQWAAWVAWDHPNMPWDETQVYLAEVHDHPGGLPILKNAREIVAPHPTLSPKGRGKTTPGVAALQPEFSPDGKFLSYLCDRGGWHNLYLYDLREKTTRRLTRERSVQLGTPAWVQGVRVYGWSHDARKLICTSNHRGVSSLVAYDVRSGRASALPNPGGYTDFQQPALNPKRALLAATASSGKQTPRVLAVDLTGSSGAEIVVKRGTSETLPLEKLSQPQPIAWKTAGGGEVYGLLYRPISQRLNEKPPAIVRIHGGPTGQTRAAFSADAQFFTTRGYAVLDVNYRGSTGYGRKYMDALRGKWGVYDVQDAVSGARHLSRRGLADAGMLVIMGGSAGGYTVLQTLVEHPGLFKAGVCLFGVSNMFTLAADTHKFEARYLDSMLGPLPQAAAIYRERSPIFSADRIVDPIAVFQGDIDEVVPRAQSDTIVESLKRRGVPHEYHVYQGEGHGWRKAETVEAYYASVEKFLKNFVLFA